MSKFDVFDDRWILWDLIEDIRDRIYTNINYINEWEYTKYNHIDVNDYEKKEDGIIRFNETWDGSYTYVFEKRFQLPDDFIGKDLVMNIDIEGESLLYVNGVAKGSVDFGHKCVYLYKNDVVKELNFRLESTKHFQEYVRSERMYRKDYKHLIFNKITICEYSKETMEFYYLCKVLLDIVTNEDDTSIINEITSILKDELHKIDFNESKFQESIKIGYENLIVKIRNLNIPYKYGTMFFQGHSHLDLAFKWQEKDTINKVNRTNTNTIEILDKYENEKMVFSQVRILEYMEEHFPKQFDEIKRQVAEGKVEIVSDIYTEFDTNIPSAEGIIRNILYGRKYIEKNFSKESKVCYLPDTFGFSAILPQILKKCNYEYFATTKLNWNEYNKFPKSFFNWKGIDGTEIKSYLLPKGYGGEIDLKSIKENYENSPQRKMGKQIFQYGFGDGGGGISHDMLESLKAIESINSFVKVERENMEDSIKKIFPSENIDTIEGELYLEKHRGVYTSQHKIKKYNRQLEGTMYNVELLATILKDRGLEYPKVEIDYLWKNLIFNQFHDIISGSLIEEAVRDTEKIYKDTKKRAELLIEELLGKIINRNNKCITVFNNMSWSRDIEVYVKTLEDIKGNELYDSIYFKSLEKEKIYKIIIKNITGYGFKSIRISDDFPVTLIEEKDLLSLALYKNYFNTILENDYYRLEFNKDGILESIYDKEFSCNILKESGEGLEVFYDRPGYFDSWDISNYYENNKIKIEKVNEIEILEENPLYKTIKISYSFKSSTCNKYITLYENKKEIGFRFEIDGKDSNLLIKNRFDFDIETNDVLYDLSMGYIKRSNKINNNIDKAKYEVPYQKWLALHDNNKMVSIINKGKYGVDTKDSKVRVTLLKTAVYPDKNQDLGKSTMEFKLVSLKKDDLFKIIQKSYEYNIQSIGTLGKLNCDIQNFLQIQQENIIIESIKASENNTGYIIRVYEALGKRSKIKVNFKDRYHKVEECNILEEKISDLKENIIDFEPFEIKTIKLIN